MTECVDTRIGNLLHAYEMGILTDEERVAFEEHLYDCDYCFREAKQLSQVTRLLRHSSRIRAEAAGMGHSAKKAGISRLLLLAAAVLLVAAPSYFFISKSHSPTVTQSLYLAPLRGNGPPALDLSLGGTADIQFVVEGANITDTSRVVISVRKGPTIYTDDAFVGFNEFGEGTISLPVDSFEKGYYILTVTGSGAMDTLTLAEYPFRVK